MSCGCKVRDNKTVKAVRWFYIAIFGFIITYAIFYVAASQTHEVAQQAPAPQGAISHAEL